MNKQEIKETIRVLKNMKPDRYEVSFKKKDGSVVDLNMDEKSLDTWLILSPGQIIDYRKM